MFFLAYIFIDLLFICLSLGDKTKRLRTAKSSLKVMWGYFVSLLVGIVYWLLLCVSPVVLKCHLSSLGYFVSLPVGIVYCCSCVFPRWFWNVVWARWDILLFIVVVVCCLGRFWVCWVCFWYFLLVYHGGFMSSPKLFVGLPLGFYVFLGVFVFFWNVFWAFFGDFLCVFFWAVCVFFRERFGEVRGSGLAEVCLLG